VDSLHATNEEDKKGILFDVGKYCLGKVIKSIASVEQAISS